MLRTRPLLALVCLAALAGCGGLSGLLNYGDEGPPPPVATAAAPVPVPPPAAAAGQPDEWCLRVAANDRVQAAQNGFDAATQDRVTAQSYRQCVALKAS